MGIPTAILDPKVTFLPLWSGQSRALRPARMSASRLRRETNCIIKEIIIYKHQAKSQLFILGVFPLLLGIAGLIVRV